jgi:hypothetical protein
MMRFAMAVAWRTVGADARMMQGVHAPYLMHPSIDVDAEVAHRIKVPLHTYPLMKGLPIPLLLLAVAEKRHR